MGVDLHAFIEFLVLGYENAYDLLAELGDIAPNRDLQLLFYKDEKGFPKNLCYSIEYKLFEEIGLRQEDGYWMTTSELEAILEKWKQQLIEYHGHIGADPTVVILQAVIAMMKSLDDTGTHPRFVYYFM